MNFKEYGDNSKDTIMLLHGGGLSWWNYREEAEKLKDKRLQKEEQEEITVTASTMDELIQKINDVLYPWKQIEQEYVGKHINYLG